MANATDRLTSTLIITKTPVIGRGDNKPATKEAAIATTNTRICS